MIIESILPILTEGATYKVTSPFGYRTDPFTGKENAAHKGVDLVRWQGEYSLTSGIGAAWDGVVTKTAYDNSRGHYVVIDHGDGITTEYYHLVGESIHVYQGETVTAGQEIGYMGKSGAVTGAHLHFQMEIGGVAVDPLPYITGEDMIVHLDAPTSEMDNTPAEWAEEAVRWAQENGILYGDDTGNLHLHDPVTCERMLVFLHRAYKLAVEGSAG
jgi:hypothetical protein